MNSTFEKPLWLHERDWLCTVEFLNDHDPEAQDDTSEVIGYLLAYARQTNTRSLALLADPHGVAWHGPSHAAVKQRRVGAHLVCGTPQQR